MEMNVYFNDTQCKKFSPPRKATESWVLTDLRTLKEILFPDWFGVAKQP